MATLGPDEIMDVWTVELWRTDMSAFLMIGCVAARSGGAPHVLAHAFTTFCQWCSQLLAEATIGRAQRKMRGLRASPEPDGKFWHRRQGKGDELCTSLFIT